LKQRKKTVLGITVAIAPIGTLSPMLTKRPGGPSASSYTTILRTSSLISACITNMENNKLCTLCKHYKKVYYNDIWERKIGGNKLPDFFHWCELEKREVNIYIAFVCEEYNKLKKANI